MINRIVQKYNVLSKPLKASLWFMVSSIINKGIAFITTPLFTRLLTQKEYGIVSLYSTWVVLLTIVITFELATGVFNKAMIKYEMDKDGYTSSSLVLITLLITCFFVIYLIFHNIINAWIDLPPLIIVFMFVEILATTTWDLYAIRQRFEYDYKEIVIVTVIVNIIATMLSLLLVKIFPEHRPEARTAGLALTHFIIYSFYYYRILKRGRVFVKREYWAYSLSYNIPLIPHYLSQQVLNQSDRIMIGKMLGNVEAGIYSLAYQVAVVMQIVTNAVHVSFMPWCFQCLRNNKIKQIGKSAFQIEILIGITCLTFSLYAPEFVLVLGGKAYYSAIYIIPPVSMSIVFLTIYSFYANIEFYFEETKIVMFASVIVATSNILLNWILIPIFGFVATGYTTLACYIIYAAVHYGYMLYVCKKNKIDNPFDGKKMWTTAVVLAGLSITVSIIYSYTIIRLILATCLLIGCGIFFMKNRRILLMKE